MRLAGQPLDAARARARHARRALRVWSHVDERVAGLLRARARARRRAARSRSSARREPRPPTCCRRSSRRSTRSVPLIVLTADRPPELRDCGAPQTIDQTELFGSHVALVRRAAARPRRRRTRCARWHAHARASRAYGDGRAAAGGTGAPEPARSASRWCPTSVPTDLAAIAERRAAGRAIRARRGPQPRRRAAPIAAVTEIAARSQGAPPVDRRGPLDDPDPSLPAPSPRLRAALGAPVLAEPASNLRRRGTTAATRRRARRAAARGRVHATRTAPDVVLRLGAPPTSKALAHLARAPRRRDRRCVVDGRRAWPDPAGVATTSCAAAARSPASRARWRRALPARAPDRRLGSRAGGAPVRARARRSRRARRARPRAVRGARRRATLAAGAARGDDAVRRQQHGGARPRLRSGPPTHRRCACSRTAARTASTASSPACSAPRPRRAGPVVGLCGDLSFYHDLNGLLAAAPPRPRAPSSSCSTTTAAASSTSCPVARCTRRVRGAVRHAARPRPAAARSRCTARASSASTDPSRASRAAVADALCRRRATTVVSHVGDRTARTSLAAHRRAWRAPRAPRSEAARMTLAADGARARGRPLVAAARLHRHGRRLARRARLLGDRRRVVAVDLPGHGASPPPARRRDFPRRPMPLVAVLDRARRARRRPGSATRWAGGSRCTSPSRIRSGSRRWCSRARRPASPIPPSAPRASPPTTALAADASSATASRAFVDRWMAQPLFATAAPSRPAEVARARALRACANRPAGLAAALRGLGVGAPGAALGRGCRRRAVSRRCWSPARTTRSTAAARATRWRAAPAARRPSRVVPDAGHTVHLEQPAAFWSLVGAFLAERLCVRAPEGGTRDDRLDARALLHRHPLREDRATASPRSPSTGPRCATPSGRRRSSSWPTPSPTRARTREVGVVILTGEGRDAFCSGGDQRVRGTGGLRRRRRRAAPQRARPAAPDPHAAQAGDRHGRRLRHRRRPRAARGLRPHHRRRQRRLRPDRPERRQLRRRLRRDATWRASSARRRRARSGSSAAQYDAAAGARHGPRQRGRAARRARGGDGAVVPRDAAPSARWRCAASRPRSTPTATGWPGSRSSPATRRCSTT